MNRRLFMRSVAFMAVAMGGPADPIWARERGEQGRPFGWHDAENRSNVEHARFAEDGRAVVLQVTRPLSAGGEFFGPGWGSAFDPRADLWLLNDKLANARRLSRLHGGAWSPCFSPDGTRLAALTMTKPGKVGLVVWDLERQQYQIFSDPNVELFLAKFRTAESACAAPRDFLQVPRQYLWLDGTTILYVDHGSDLQQSLLAVSSLSPLRQGFRQRTEEGRRAVRVWDARSPTCGAGSCLSKMSCEGGHPTILYSGDVRGVSVSPDGRWLALVVATNNILPIPNKPMEWQLLATTPFDDSMVQWKLTVLDLTGRAGARDVARVTGVGNVAPSRLPLWTADSSRIAIPVRMTDSDEPSTGNDAVWEVDVGTGHARKWIASSALDAELIAALITTEGLNEHRVIDGRPLKIPAKDYVGAGQVMGGAWRCAPGRVIFWSDPDLTLISRTNAVAIPGKFSSVQPPVAVGAVSRMVAVQADRKTVLITVSSDTAYHVEDVVSDPKWELLAVSPTNPSLVYKDDAESGTFLMLSTGMASPRRSPLSFNTYLKGVLRPESRILTCTFADGSVRRGLLQLPIGHRTGDRHPVIVWAYPNFQPSSDDSLARINSFNSIIYPIQYLLTKGFALFQAPFPIRGAPSARPMRAAVEAVEPWLDVLARQTDVISEEYGLFGHSNAGYVALALEGLTNRFKAIVAWDTFPEIGFDTLHSTAGDVGLNCAANLIQSARKYYEDPKQPYTPKPAPPWRNPVDYIRNDPLFHLNGASTPLLLVEGEFDVDPEEMEEVFSILYGQDVPVELAYYWGEYHYFASPGNIFDSWLRTEKFFKRYLKMR